MPSNHIQRRRFLKAAAAAGITGVAGCSGSTNDSGGDTTSTPTPEQPDLAGDGSDTTEETEQETTSKNSGFWEKQDERLKEAAEKAPDEPALVFYHNYTPGSFEKMVEDFRDHAEEEYGFRPKVDFYRAAAARVASRVESEKRSGQLKASFGGLSAPGVIQNWAKKGWVEEWLPPVLGEHYPESVYSKDSYMHWGVRWYPMCISVGPSVIDGDVPKPKSYVDLVMDDQYCGNFTSYNMTLGGGASWYHTIWLHKKLKSGDFQPAGVDEVPSWEEFAKQFYRQSPYFSASSVNMLQQVGKGEYAAHLTSLQQWSIKLRVEENVDVQEVYPESGMPMFFNAECLFKDAPALNTAMLWQNWWLSEDAQKKYTSLEYDYSAHENVDGVGGTDYAPPLDSLKVDLPPWREYNSKRSDIVSQLETWENQTSAQC